MTSHARVVSTVSRRARASLVGWLAQHYATASPVLVLAAFAGPKGGCPRGRAQRVRVTEVAVRPRPARGAGLRETPLRSGMIAHPPSPRLGEGRIVSSPD